MLRQVTVQGKYCAISIMYFGVYLIVPLIKAMYTTDFYHIEILFQRDKLSKLFQIYERIVTRKLRELVVFFNNKTLHQIYFYQSMHICTSTYQVGYHGNHQNGKLPMCKSLVNSVSKKKDPGKHLDIIVQKLMFLNI